MSAIATAASKRADDMRPYRLGESGIIVYDRHDLTFIFGAVVARREIDMERAQWQAHK
jgi:hypothetical protein